MQVEDEYITGKDKRAVMPAVRRMVADNLD